MYAALALAVPLPALALERGGGPGSLDVQASLGGCGVADAAITCRIDVAFSGIPDAEYYTASVTAPDGSVLELGRIATSGDGGASTSASVPFAGNGEYTVTVSAWGYDERGRPDVVESERSSATPDAGSKSAGELEAAAPEGTPTPEEEPHAPEQDPPAAPEIEQPACPEPAEPPEPTGPPEPAEPAHRDPAAEAQPAPTTEAEAGGPTVPGCEQPPEPEPPPVP